MNATQTAQLASATTRKARIDVLKSLRSAGVEIKIKLTTTNEKIAAEVARLLALAASAAEAIVSAVKVASSQVKANLAYWLAAPVKALNKRAVRGAIALSLKLFGTM